MDVNSCPLWTRPLRGSENKASTPTELEQWRPGKGWGFLVVWLLLLKL